MVRRRPPQDKIHICSISITLVFKQLHSACTLDESSHGLLSHASTAVASLNKSAFCKSYCDTIWFRYTKASDSSLTWMTSFVKETLLCYSQLPVLAASFFSEAHSYWQDLWCEKSSSFLERTQPFVQTSRGVFMKGRVRFKCQHGSQLFVCGCLNSEILPSQVLTSCVSFYCCKAKVSPSWRNV